MQQESIISKASTLVKLANNTKSKLLMSPPENDNQMKTGKRDAIENKSIN
jgi:hypothetical protein